MKCITNSSQFPIKVPVNTKLLGVQSGNYLNFFGSTDGIKPRNSCRCLFKRPAILSVPCECIFSLMSSLLITNKNYKRIQLYIILRNEDHLQRPITELLG